MGVITILGVSTETPAGWEDDIEILNRLTVSESVKVAGVAVSKVVPSKVTVKGVAVIGI